MVRSDNATRASCNFLVKGHVIFVKKVLNLIGTRHVRSSVYKAIAICYGRIQGEFSIPGFQWGSYTLAGLGGVTSGRFCVGCSISVKQLGNVIITVYE